MERLNIPWKYKIFYEDEPEGSKNFNLLPLEKCKAWLQSIADQLLDSKVEKEIVLYEFSDRPEGFPKPNFPQVLEPWKHASMAIFSTKERTTAPPNPKHLVARVPPVYPVGASRPDARDGAGPSRPSHPLNVDEDHDSTLKASKQNKIAEIRASLEYNGYPPDVIEDLLQNNVDIELNINRTSFDWTLILPNRKLATRYGNIEANPYPGGKISEKSARKCQISHCYLSFGHLGPCRRNSLHKDATAEVDTGLPRRNNNTQSAPTTNSLDALLHHATAGVRTALEYVGYPLELIAKMMKNDYQIVAYPNNVINKYGWALRLPNGKLIDSMTEIQKNPYPGGTGAMYQVCNTLGCGKKIGHFGRCPVPESDRYEVKRKADFDAASPPPLKKRSGGSILVPSFTRALPHQSNISSSSDDDEENFENGKEQDDRVIYLLSTTEEEDSADKEGEDEYSSLED